MCSRTLKMRWPKVRVVSKTASPYLKPRSRNGTRTSRSGTKRPLKYAMRSGDAMGPSRDWNAGILSPLQPAHHHGAHDPLLADQEDGQDRQDAQDRGRRHQVVFDEVHVGEAHEAEGDDL